MVNINKYKINNYDCFDICTDDGVFQIFFCGNLDLYFSYVYEGDRLNRPDSKDFYITKENYFLYSLFDELYNDVKDYNIFTIDNFDSKEDFLDRKAYFLECDRQNPRKLFKDNKIDWHCDDFEYDKAGSFIIEKLDNSYKLTFNKCKDDSLFGIMSSYSVRLRNSGSRYDGFNLIFMRMYRKLCNYDPNFQQIHIEEYMYNKKLVKKKETI